VRPWCLRWVVDPLALTPPGRMNTLSPTELVRRIERTLTRADATQRDVEQLCQQARAQSWHSVCVCGSRVELACSLLDETGVKVTGLVGFPHGAADSDAKRFETEVAVDHGAHEIEVVLSIGRLKDGDDRYVLRELRDIAEAADERPVKVVLETTLLTPDEIKRACALTLDSGAHCVCTGTGLLAAPTADVVQQLRAAVGVKFGLKAAGVRDLQSAMAMIDAGATRLGLADGVTELA
jgi:deoxyribose-phosphate aldolase